MTSTSYTYDPNTQTFIMANMPLGMSVGAADNTWCCFGDCRKGGSILELVVSFR
jgi:hypothetical protein